MEWTAGCSLLVGSFVLLVFGPARKTMQTCRLACVRLIWLTRSEMCSGREPAPLSKNDPVTCDALPVFYYSNAIMLACLTES